MLRLLCIVTLLFPALAGAESYDVPLGALAEAIEVGADLGLTIVGDGEDRDALHAQVAMLGLGTR